MNNHNDSILIIGYANVDIVAIPNDDNNIKNKHGEVTLDIGGTGFNLAIHAASFGMRTKFLTVLPENSPFSSIIKNQLDNKGIHYHAVSNGITKDSVFCSIMDTRREIVTSISSSQVNNVSFQEEKIIAMLNHCLACVIDCSLPEDELTKIIKIVNLTKIPLFICLSSEENSVKIANLNGDIAGIFASKRELSFLSDFIGKSPKELASYFNTTIICTQGTEGVCIYKANGKYCYIEMRDIGGDKNFIGMHDVIAISTVIHLIFSKQKIETAVDIAIVAAVEESLHKYQIMNLGGSIYKEINSMQKQANLDSLTGLPNRSAAIHKLDILKTKYQNFYIAIIDIDHFKKVNDTFGHDIGDEVLKNVAESLQNSLRDNDFCARWGGEEFIFIANRIHSHELIQQIMNRTRKSVENIQWQGDWKLSISVGISEFKGQSIESVIKEADIALYQAKNEGRNQVVFYQNKIYN